MAAVARGHGGDAGADPPRGPSRIPTGCEGSTKKGRDRSRGLNLLQAFNNNRRRPLPIEFDSHDQRTFLPVRKNHSLFTRLIANWIGQNIPMYYGSWENVPTNLKMSLWPEIENLIASGIERLCKDRFRDRKNKQKKHFLDHGGYEEPDEARRNPPHSTKQEDWYRTVEHFDDDIYKARSQKNAENRAKAQFQCLQGSASYIVARYKKTQELPSLFDTWQDIHTREGEWVNETAHEYHMLAEQQASHQQGSDDSSSSVNEKEIMHKVLRECRSHNRGRGRKLKGDASSSFQSTMPPPRSSFTDEHVQQMQSNFQYVILQFSANQETMMNVIRNFVPDPTVPNLAPINYNFSFFAPPPPQQIDADEDEDED